MKRTGNKVRAQAIQNLRRSGAAGVHQDRRTKRMRQRGQRDRAEIRMGMES
jgi:hypothetical protein